MYPQFSMPLVALPNELHGFQKCLIAANWTLVASVVLLSLTIAISFIFPDHFSMQSQMLAHVGTIVLAGVLKVGYVLRCVALHGLGESV